MSSGLIDAIRRANAPRPPENSLALRGAILAAVMTGAAAIGWVNAISRSTALGVLVALPLAYWVSWTRRSRDNWAIKIALSVGAILALMRFLSQIGGVGTLDEIRFPLADLFLWVQVLHSFDLPARKDLQFSLGSSLTLMAVAGSISQDTTYLIFVLAYFGFAVASLYLSHRSYVSDGVVGWVAPPGRQSRDRGGWTEVGKAVGVTALAAAVLFLVLPQPSGIRTFALPFSLGTGGGLSPLGGGGIANPGSAGPGGLRSTGGSYYGIDGRMDLRVRGGLSDDLVMRVRSSAPAMWKGMIFETYDGISWQAPESDAIPLGDVGPFHYPLEFRSLGPRATVSQTFYIEVEQASVIFAAGQPDEVWSSQPVLIDEIGGLRLGSTLTPGTVYSVVSSRGAATPAELRSAGEEYPEHIRRFLQLPDDIPRRVHDLARRITANALTPYDKVEAIETWLRDRYRYSINSPVPPPGQDAVDHFLFETDVGFCEQFASATTVLLRSLGVPARVVAGFTPGSRNAFTGYYEVKGSDAHSWIEVWFPQLGWYEFDPTFAIPPARVDIADVVPLARILRFAAEKIGSLLPEGAGGFVQTALVVLLVAAVAAGAALAWVKLRPRPVVAAAAAVPSTGGGPVTRAFRQLEGVLAMRGAGRAPPETAAELMSRTADLAEPATRHALEVFEKERYGPLPPDQTEAAAAVRELKRLTEQQLTTPPARS